MQMSSQSKANLPQLSVGKNTIEDIMSRAYDSFDVQLTSLQLLYSKPGTNLSVYLISHAYTHSLENWALFRWRLAEGSEAEAVLPPYSGASRLEGDFQQSHGCY